MKATLVFEDGTTFTGQSFGAEGQVCGEVVFNTGMVGYQEILTDPSYCGQIVTLTYPLIGNYGVNSDDFESAKPQVRALVVREWCKSPSNWRMAGNIDEFLAQHGIIGISEVDTRALTRYLRRHGARRGAVFTGETPPENLSFTCALDQNLVQQVSTRQIYHLPGNGYKVVVVDCGVKRNILRSLQSRGCAVTVVPYDTTAEEIMALQPDGVLFSNGAGDPKDVPMTTATLKTLLGRIPIFGICLGHQLLGLALGGDTYKLKFGHRGVNHPVKDLTNNRVYITSQNHGYAVDERSLNPEEVVVTHRNLNDGTVEGIEHKYLQAFSVQYHPEASPGPNDSGYLFDKFLAMMKGGK